MLVYTIDIHKSNLLNQREYTSRLINLPNESLQDLFNNLSAESRQSWMSMQSEHRKDISVEELTIFYQNLSENEKEEFMFLMITELRSRNIFDLISNLDLNVGDIKVNKNENYLGDYKDDEGNEIPDNRMYIPSIGHNVFEKGKKTDEFEYFNLEHEESTGTKKIYEIAGSIIDALFLGKTMIIDEFNTSLHPMICEAIISLFTNKHININHAQLIIATHDLHILDPCNLKREQIWFTEKDKYGITDLFSMEEFDVEHYIQDNKPFSKYYMTGRFGALPRINTSILKGGIFNAKK